MWPSRRCARGLAKCTAGPRTAGDWGNAMAGRASRQARHDLALVKELFARPAAARMGLPQHNSPWARLTSLWRSRGPLGETLARAAAAGGVPLALLGVTLVGTLVLMAVLPSVPPEPEASGPTLAYEPVAAAASVTAAFSKRETVPTEAPAADLLVETIERVPLFADAGGTAVAELPEATLPADHAPAIGSLAPRAAIPPAPGTTRKAAPDRARSARKTQIALADPPLPRRRPFILALPTTTAPTVDPSLRFRTE